jgi:hypothetical protein
VAFLALDVCDEADAAGIVFVGRAVEALLLRLLNLVLHGTPSMTVRQDWRA